MVLLGECRSRGGKKGMQATLILMWVLLMTPPTPLQKAKPIITYKKFKECTNVGMSFWLDRRAFICLA